MITKQDLLESIAECQGIRTPNANTCMKLAAFYTILDHLEDEPEPEQNEPQKRQSFTANHMSFSTPEEVVKFYGSGDFAQTVNGMPSQEAWTVMNELMSMLQMIEPKLYNAVMRKLQEVQR